MRILTYAIVIVSSCVFSGVCSEDELLMDPSKSPYTVVEGTYVKLTCYTRDREGIISALWKIEETLVANTTRNNSGNCRIVYAPTNIYRSERTTASCKRASSSLMIERVTNANAKNWSCSSGGFHVQVLLKMDTRKENTPLPPVLVTSPQTTDLPSESENTSHSTYLLTSPPTTDVPRESENASTRFQQSDMDVDYNLVIICAGTAGGILAFVLLLVGLLKVVASVRDHVSKRERTRAYSTSPVAEMTENPVYWTAGNMTATEARHEMSVADGCPGNDHVSKRERTRAYSTSSVAEMTENPVYWTAGNMTATEAKDEMSVADGCPGNGNTVETINSKAQRSEVKPKTEPESGNICAKPEKRKEIPSDKLEEQS